MIVAMMHSVGFILGSTLINMIGSWHDDRAARLYQLALIR